MFRDDVTLLRQEIQDLQASLKEEKWYSEELKKELEKFQGLQQQVIAFKYLKCIYWLFSLLKIKHNTFCKQMT